MKRIAKQIGWTALFLAVWAIEAHAATSGTALDGGYTAEQGIIQGPVAGLAMASGLGGGAITWGLTHHLTSAVGTFAGLMAGGILAANSTAIIQRFAPGAGALIW